MTTIGRLSVCVLGAALLAPRSALRAQARLDLGGAIEVGGEAERYLRVLQIAGLAPLGPWSIQPFSGSVDDALRRVSPNQPWNGRLAPSLPAGDAFDGEVLRPRGRLIVNSTYPFQATVGPTWAGRGITGEAQLGVQGRWRFVRMQLAPIAFLSQNAAFPLAPNGLSGDDRFADARYPLNIDVPQRFGTGAYGRIDPGTSFISANAAHVELGFSTAPQRWGPARDYPLVLGPSAGGFPNAFAGISDPVNVFIGRIQGRALYGYLGQSKYAAPVDSTRGRLGSGVIGVFMPRGLDGLEIGVTRFMERPWQGFPSGDVILRPFSGLISNNTPGSDLNKVVENQAASIFARWAVPRAKAEFYGEMYREDYSGGFHVAGSSLVEEPDDYSAFTIGLQRVITSSARATRVVRAELVNAETSHQERGERGFTVPLPIYIHGEETQGHTLDGRVLGSPEAYGGAAWRIGLDEFTPRGRRSISLERTLRFDWLSGQPAPNPTFVHPDVIYAVRAEALRFVGSHDYTLSLVPSVDLNRNLVAHHDVFNLNVSFAAGGW